MERFRFLALALVCALLAGCASGEATAPADLGYSALGPAFTQEEGAIGGLITNQQGIPIEGADVKVKAAGLATRSDAQGRFTLSYLAPGPYNLDATARGFHNRSLEVEVRAAELSRATLALSALPSKEPRIDVVSNPVLFSYCAADLFGLCGAFLMCSGCNWMLPFKDDPSYFIFEASGRHTAPKPTGPDVLNTWARAEGSNNRSGLWDCQGLNYPPASCGRLPIKMGFARDAYEGTTTLRVSQACEFEWVCVSERYTDYASFFYHTPEAKVPGDYSAIPKG